MIKMTIKDLKPEDALHIGKEILFWGHISDEPIIFQVTKELLGNPGINVNQTNLSGAQWFRIFGYLTEKGYLEPVQSPAPSITLQECKDKVAQKYGFKDWNDCEDKTCRNNEWKEAYDIMREVNKLYASQAPKGWYPSTEFPLCVEDENFSVDVITRNLKEGDGGMLNIGYYNFDTQKWAWHTDTLVDMYEHGHETDFVWTYSPEFNAEAQKYIETHQKAHESEMASNAPVIQEALSWEEALNTVAVQHNFLSWEEVKTHSQTPFRTKLLVMERAAQLFMESNRLSYGKQCWERGAQEMKNCILEFYAHHFPIQNEQVESAPIPPFKP